MSYTEKLRELQEQEIIPADSEEAAFSKLLGYNLARAREKKGLLQKQLAEQAGLTQSAWSRIERGDIRLTVYDLMVCAKVLGKRLQDLVPP